MGIKIILSRKGMDTSIGKLAGPIFEDGRMLLLPIPIINPDEKKAHEEHKYDGFKYRYSDLEPKDEYAKIINDFLKEDHSSLCHLDPDIDQSRASQINGWKPAFGQSNQAAKYLLNGIDKCQINIKEDKLIFLFFGRFHYVELFEEKYRYTKLTGCPYKDNDIHVIWGYLVVDKIETECFSDYLWHPHSTKYYTDKDNNVIFVGEGNVLKFDPKRVLTKMDRDGKKVSMAVWDKKKFTADCNAEECLPFKYHGSRKNSASNKKDELFLRGQWQELLLTDDDQCKELLKRFGLDYLISTEG